MILFKFKCVSIFRYLVLIPQIISLLIQTFLSSGCNNYFTKFEKTVLIKISLKVDMSNRKIRNCNLMTFVSF